MYCESVLGKWKPSIEQKEVEENEKEKQTLMGILFFIVRNRSVFFKQKQTVKIRPFENQWLRNIFWCAQLLCYEVLAYDKKSFNVFKMLFVKAWTLHFAKHKWS